MALRISVALTIITNPIVVSSIIEHLFSEFNYQQLTLTEPNKNTFIFADYLHFYLYCSRCDKRFDVVVDDSRSAKIIFIKSGNDKARINLPLNLVFQRMSIFNRFVSVYIFFNFLF